VTQREEKSFELDPGEVASARRFVARVLLEWDIDADDVILAVGELAANAVLHARTSFTVTVCQDSARLTVEVADHNPRLPAMGQPPLGALSGRGLMLVDAVSTAWGVRTNQLEGKLVWAEFDASQDPPPSIGPGRASRPSAGRADYAF
jgi:anti-sigma regulatory factor (Ser/Thr protein kinase)